MKKNLSITLWTMVFLWFGALTAWSETDQKPAPPQPVLDFSSLPVSDNQALRKEDRPGTPDDRKVKKHRLAFWASGEKTVGRGHDQVGTDHKPVASGAVSIRGPARGVDDIGKPSPGPHRSAGHETVGAAFEENRGTSGRPEIERHRIPPVPGSRNMSASMARDDEPVQDPMLHLTLEDCLKIAFAQNRLRRISAESVKIAEAQYQQALSGHWPQLKFSLTGVRMDEDPTFVFPSQPLALGQTTSQYLAEAIAVAQLAKLGMAPGTSGYDAALAAATQQAAQGLSGASMPAYKVKLMDRDLLSSTLQLVLPLYTGGKVSAVARQAKAGLEASREGARKTDLQIIREVKQYFYGHVFAKKLHALGNETLQRFEATQAVTESVYRHGSGKVKKTDYLRSKMMTATIRSVVELLKSNEDLSKSVLAHVMGIPWNTPIAVSQADIPFATVSGDLDRWVAQAQKNNPQVNQVRLGLAAGEGKIAEARAGHLPVIAFFGNLTRLDNTYDGGLITDENRHAWQIGVSIELPIFNGWRTSREVQEAKLKLEKLKQESLLLQEGVALQVKNSFLQMARFQGQVTALKEALAAAAENRDLNVRAYAQELVETKDVIEAQLIEFILHGQYLKALYDHRLNVDELEYLVGTSLYENR